MKEFRRFLSLERQGTASAPAPKTSIPVAISGVCRHDNGPNTKFPARTLAARLAYARASSKDWTASFMSGDSSG
jgi:hypothetical protein